MNDQAMGGMPSEPESESESQSHITTAEAPGDIILRRIEQQEQATVDGFRDVKNYLDNVLEAIRSISSNTAGALNRSKLIPDFSAETARLEEEKNKLSLEVTALRDENKIIRSQLEQKGVELGHVEGEMERMRSKEIVLRNIILDKAGNQKVSDNEVKGMFAYVRQRVQSLCANAAFDVNRSIRPSRCSGDQAAFFDNSIWKDLSPKDRMNRFHARMFRMLYHSILDAELFGLSGLEVQDGDKHTLVEAPLRRFERLLMNRRVNSANVDDWRILTIECGAQLNHQARTGKVVAEDIFEFFTPILAKGTGQKLEQELLANIQELCDNAFNLRMVMRKSKDGYRCEMPDFYDTKRGLLSEYADLSEGFGVEGGKNNEGGEEIAYFMTAALTKHQGSVDNNRIMVLEKGFVILKRN